MILDESILKEFVQESKSLISESLEILEEVEGNPSQIKKLEIYGNSVDRIMGGAKNLALMAEPTHPIHFIGDYCALCKAVGYKSSQIVNNPDFLMICVALLLDATETLSDMVNKIASPEKVGATTLSKTFLDRLQWVSNQFGNDIRETVGNKASGEKSFGQSEIDELLRKLGI